ncbi:MAG TPA: hypothetical protein VMZ04_09690 [Anaerolineae bacterium]|nr:hypothetical protein [Anaerolineae bacterium]
MTVEKIEDTSLWDKFVEASPQGTVFSTSQWLNAVSSVQGGEPLMVGVWKNDQLIAGVSCIHIAHGPFKKATSPVMTPYGGIIYRPDPGKRHSEAESFNMSCAQQLIKYLNTRYHQVFLVHTPEFKDIRPFTWAGWSEKVHYTYIMDITDTKRLWDLLECNVRTVIRNAESTLELGGPIDTEHFMELYKRIYHDRGWSPPVRPTMVNAMLNKVINSNMAEMRTVYNKHGNVILAGVLVYDARSVYAWISGSIPGENTSGAFSLHFWDAVKRHTGIHEKFDMVGANIPSISFFKKRFAGVLTPYYVTERYSSPISQVIMRTYSSMKRFKRW